MRLIFLFLLCSFTHVVLAQDITLDYINDKGIIVKDIPINKDTKKIVVEDFKSFKKFGITIKNLPANHKITFLDEANIEIGSINADGTQTFTAGVELNNSIIKIIDNNNGVKTPFANVLLQILPKSKLDMVSKITALSAISNTVCTPCNYKGNSITYSFSDNSLSYATEDNKSNFSKGRPIVGKPFSFRVTNINPFRDSIIIGSETIDFNTDMPDLFNTAFFSPALHGVNPNKEKILSDIFELGEQLKRIVSTIKDLKECTNICTITQDVKTETEKYFTTTYSFNPKTQDFIPYVLSNLDGISPLYRDSVSNILNDYRNLLNARNYFNYNIPRVQNVDQYIFTLSIIPKSGSKSYTIVDHQPIAVNTVGGAKFDFSTGLFVTNLLDENFSLRPDSTVIQNSYGGDSIVFHKRNQIVQLSDKKKVDFGVAALMHFYPRISPFFNIGLSLGAGLSIGPNPAIRYLGGGSLLFGKSGRLAISYGCAAGFVNVLADGYQNNQYISLGDPKAIIKKSFKTNSFWAATFNIPLFKTKAKTEAAKPPSTDEAKKDETKKEDPKAADKDKKAK